MIKILTRYLTLLIFILCAWVMYFFTLTTSGLQILVGIATLALPGKISIHEIDGRLLSSISLHGIEFQSPEQHIYIESLNLHWLPIQLLNKKCHITDLNVGNTQIKIAHHSTANKPYNPYPVEWMKFFTIDKINVQNLTIIDENNSMIVNGSIKQNWDINWKVTITDIKSLTPNAQGRLLGNGHISGERFNPTLIANIDINNLLINDYHFKNIRLSGEGHCHSTDQLLQANANIAVNKQPILRLNIGVKKKRLNGFFDIRITDLSFLTLILNEIQHPSGTFLAHTQLSGDITKPIIKTHLELHNGQTFIPDLGIKLENIHLLATTDTHQQINLTGTLQSGSGIAKLEGKIDLSKPNLPGKLSLHGDDLQLVNLSNYKITASPNLQLNFTNTNATLDGTIFVPEANITPSDFSNTTTMPDEVIYVGQTKQQNTPVFSHLNLNVTIKLGDNIVVKYEDLEATMGGTLNITQEPGGRAIGYGELYTTSGKYHAYGKTLTIQQGKLTYTGNPLLNPGLHIRATREINTVATTPSTNTFSNNPITQPTYLGTDVIHVGIQIQGTAQNPLISLYSSPTMSQGDTLSYLLFGYPQSQATGTNQIGALLTAASSLSPSGKTPLSDITNRVQDKLGLSELGVGSTEMFSPTTGTTVATTSFIVGKQLAKNLYLHYSIGLFNPVSVLNLRYTLGKRWSIQSETSTIDSGADLLYSLERE